MDDKTISVTEKVIGDTLYIVESAVSNAAKETAYDKLKRMMLNEHLDVSSAAFKVGYESPSQFSREYSRLFGVPPKRDIATLRAQASGM